MSTSALTRQKLPVHSLPRANRRSLITTWKTLTKLKLTSMATLPAMLAYLAAPSPSGHGFWLTLVLVFGVFISASGAAALNQWTERFSDTKMIRTRFRPIPAGHMSASTALLLGLALVGIGTVLLALFFNPLTALLTLAAAVIYWLIYTPLKKISPWCTEIGAVSGALPPLIGWAAATGSLSPFAWFLFAVLFLWQMPHFHPIAWRHRRDYARAELCMRAVVEPTGDQAARHSIFYAILLLALTSLPFVTGQIGAIAFVMTGLMGAAFVLHTFRFRFGPNRDLAAGHLFRFSLVYLPVVLATLTADQYLGRML